MKTKMGCSRCGALILLLTAAETGGICIPCQRGYRAQIDASKLRRVEEKKYEQSAERKHWLWLVEQVSSAPNGFETLSAANQAVFAVGVLEGDVYRGGFESYFFNRSADHYVQAVNTLMELSATNALRIVIAAKETLFGLGPLPASIQTRRTHLQANHDQATRAEKMAAFDAMFCNDPDELRKKVEAFAERHGLRRPFDD